MLVLVLVLVYTSYQPPYPLRHRLFLSTSFYFGAHTKHVISLSLSTYLSGSLSASIRIYIIHNQCSQQRTKSDGRSYNTNSLVQMHIPNAVYTAPSIAHQYTIIYIYIYNIRTFNKSRIF